MVSVLTMDTLALVVGTKGTRSRLQTWGMALGGGPVASICGCLLT